MRCAVFSLPNGVCDKKTDVREQITENREQITDNRRQRTDIRRQVSESRYQRTDARRQKTENGNQMSEIRNQISRLWAVICLRVSDPRLPAVFLFSQTEAFRNMLGNDPLCVFCPCIER